MELPTLVAIVADRLDVPMAYVEQVSQYAKHKDGNPYRRAAELVLLVLANGWSDWHAWHDGEPGNTALQFVSGSLEELATLQVSPLARFAYRSTVTVDREAVVITSHCDDGTETIAHTATGKWVPYLNREITQSRSASGRQLFMIAQDIASHLPAPFERRTFKLEVIN